MNKCFMILKILKKKKFSNKKKKKNIQNHKLIKKLLMNIL